MPSQNDLVLIRNEHFKPDLSPWQRNQLKGDFVFSPLTHLSFLCPQMFGAAEFAADDGGGDGDGDGLPRERRTPVDGVGKPEGILDVE